MPSKYAPVALFVYNRLDHTRRTVEALKRNFGAEQTQLYIFADGAKKPEAIKSVQEVRDYIQTIQGFESVHITTQNQNLGLARSTIFGLTEVSKLHDRFIMVEDDNLTSPHFLNYINEGLERYENDHRVATIQGYVYPIPGLPEYFFVPGCEVWGWGTWSNRWKLFEPDGRKILKRLKDRGLLSEFDRCGGANMLYLLIDQIQGKNNSWSIRWHASVFLNDLVSLQPGRSFVDNIGMDGSGEHCGASDDFKVDIRQTYDGIPDLVVAENKIVAVKMYEFYKSLQRPRNKLKSIVKKAIYRYIYPRWFIPEKVQQS
jgi:hypothetical protein